jgi:hypothetical protein
MWHMWGRAEIRQMKWRGDVACVGESRDTPNEVEGICGTCGGEQRYTK